MITCIGVAIYTAGKYGVGLSAAVVCTALIADSVVLCLILWNRSTIPTRDSAELAVGFIGFACILVAIAIDFEYNTGHTQEWWDSHPRKSIFKYYAPLAMALTAIALVEFLLFKGVLPHASTALNSPPVQEPSSVASPATSSPPVQQSASGAPVTTGSGHPSRGVHIDFVAWISAIGALLAGIGTILTALNSKKRR